MRIQPIPYDELDPELRRRFDAGLAEGRYTMTAPLQVYAYAPDEAIAMDESYRLTVRRGLLGPRLQELLRIRSAQQRLRAVLVVDQGGVRRVGRRRLSA